MFPLRSISMTIVGLLVSAIGVGALLSPATVTAEYGAGWLYQQFGIAGVAGALLIIGIIFLIWGLLGIRRAVLKSRRGGDINITR